MSNGHLPERVSYVSSGTEANSLSAKVHEIKRKMHFRFSTRSNFARMLLSPQQPPVPPLHRHDHPQPVASSSHAVPVVPKKTLFVNGTAQEVELADGRWKKYLCPHENCEKSFNRPGRLEEHLRSHSGEVSISSSLSALRQASC